MYRPEEGRESKRDREKEKTMKDGERERNGVCNEEVEKECPRVVGRRLQIMKDRRKEQRREKIKLLLSLDPISLVQAQRRLIRVYTKSLSGIHDRHRCLKFLRTAALSVGRQASAAGQFCRHTALGYMQPREE